MTGREIATAVGIDPETAGTRADAVLAIWQAAEDATAADLEPMIAEAARALETGEAKLLAESLAVPLPDRDLALMVAELVASFPPRPGQDLRIFGRMMAQDVATARPSRAALAGACRQLRASCTFLPSIKEVLDAVEAQKATCAARATLLERLPKKLAELGRPKNSAADIK